MQHMIDNITYYLVEFLYSSPNIYRDENIIFLVI